MTAPGGFRAPGPGPSRHCGVGTVGRYGVSAPKSATTRPSFDGCFPPRHGRGRPGPGAWLPDVSLRLTQPPATRLRAASLRRPVFRQPSQRRSTDGGKGGVPMLYGLYFRPGDVSAMFWRRACYRFTGGERRWKTDGGVAGQAGCFRLPRSAVVRSTCRLAGEPAFDNWPWRTAPSPPCSRSHSQALLALDGPVLA